MQQRCGGALKHRLYALQKGERQIRRTCLRDLENDLAMRREVGEEGLVLGCGRVRPHLGHSSRTRHGTASALDLGELQNKIQWA